MSNGVTSGHLSTFHAGLAAASFSTSVNDARPPSRTLPATISATPPSVSVAKLTLGSTGRLTTAVELTLEPACTGLELGQLASTESNSSFPGALMPDADMSDAEADAEADVGEDTDEGEDADAAASALSSTIRLRHHAQSMQTEKKRNAPVSKYSFDW